VVFAFGANQADIGATDFVIDAGAGFARWGRVVRSAGYGIVPSVVGSGSQGSNVSLRGPHFKRQYFDENLSEFG